MWKWLKYTRLKSICQDILESQLYFDHFIIHETQKNVWFHSNLEWKQRLKCQNFSESEKVRHFNFILCTFLVCLWILLHWLLLEYKGDFFIFCQIISKQTNGPSVCSWQEPFFWQDLAFHSQSFHFFYSPEVIFFYCFVLSVFWPSIQHPTI